MAIYYKETNPSINDNILVGYEVNDTWVNTITYDKYKLSENGIWVWVDRNTHDATVGITFNTQTNTSNNIQIKSVLELPETPEPDTWYAVQK